MRCKLKNDKRRKEKTKKSTLFYHSFKKFNTIVLKMAKVQRSRNKRPKSTSRSRMARRYNKIGGTDHELPPGINSDLFHMLAYLCEWQSTYDSIGHWTAVCSG